MTIGILLLLVALASAPAWALDEYQQRDMVKVHNQWRSAVSVPGLVWSGELALTAQRWAEDLKQNRNCAPVHSRAQGVGENIFWASPIRYSNGQKTVQTIQPAQVVNAWAGEKKFYAHATNACAKGKVCGHYTQVVWKETTQVGCGYAVCGEGSQVWVCHYAPPGNFVSQKPY